MSDLRAPFPWFGGKSRVAPQVWAALGDVQNYVEPFAGSLAVLLGRPDTHTGMIETVNDLDMYLANFWRAHVAAPAEVAYYANSPVNEADLTARHIWLVNSGAERVARLQGDPDFYDAKAAGWWVWGLCCWIGSGWCTGTGKWTADENGRLVEKGAGRGVNRKRAHLGNAGRGVNRKSLHAGSEGRGVDTGLAEITAYLTALAARLRYVRVCCGDWKRVLTPGAMDYGDPVGIFLDPPYSTALRDGGIYNMDATHGDISADVREWAIANGDNPRQRIVLAGYEGEHVMPDTWRVISWTARRAYGRSNGRTKNSDNRELERLWLSPHCVTENGGAVRQLAFGIESAA